MSYFLPSFLQKRILRYALSRLELLDTGALNLENLDITWGKRSTVELRDVGIHKRRLAALLRLPHAFSITHAKILLIRLTIPSDLYQSGIIIEAHGVDVNVNADFSSVGKEDKPNAKHTRERCGKPSKGHKANRPRSTQSYVHDPGGFGSYAPNLHDSDGHGAFTDGLPSTVDLAQSFLQTEPREEKVEVEAAMLQSQYVDQSQISLESIEEMSTVGLGGEMSLPLFLSAFLGGVVDRIQGQIRDIQVDLDLRLHLCPENDMGSDSSARPELVTLRIIIGDMAVDGVQNPVTMEAPIDNHTPSKSPAPNPRRITLNSMHILVVSESSLFSQIARSPIPSSPGTTHASTVSTARSNSSMPSSSDGLHAEHPVTSSEETADQQASLISNSSNVSQTTEGSVESGSLHASGKEAPSGSALLTSGVTRHDSPSARSFFSAMGDSRMSDRSRRPLENIDPSTYMAAGRGSSFDVPIFQGPNEDTTKERQGKSSPPSMFHAHLAPATDAAAVRNPEPARIHSAPASKSGSPAEDLTESRIFSHEEASSMYLSAISQTNLGRKFSPPVVPGHWEPSFSDCEPEDRQRPNLYNDLRLSERRFATPASSQIPLDEASAQEQVALKGNWLSSPPKLTVSGSDPSMQSRNEDASGHAKARKDNDKSNTSLQASESSADGKHRVILVKKVVSIDTIALKISAGSPRPGSDASTNPDLGFSTVIAETSTTPRAVDAEKEKPAHSVAVDINNVQFVFDMTLMKLGLLAVQQLTKTLREASPIQNQSSSGSSNCISHVPDLKMEMRNLSWQFLDLVKGHTFPLHSPSKLTRYVGATTGDSEVLLRAEVAHLQVTHQNNNTTQAIRLSVGNFRFGYALADMLSFDSALKIRDSTRDVLAPSDADILFTVQNNSSNRSIEITTLPLHVTLDLRRLDETFNWFGGLSSMLDLGSSMKSTMMIGDSKNQGPKSSEPPRGVHFEVPDSNSATRRAKNTTKNKVTARIGGLVVELQGNQSTLCLEGTAMKLVNRTEGIGIVIDRLKSSGPYLAATIGKPSLIVELSNVRLEYLSTPKEVDLERLLALVKPSQDEDKMKADDGLLLDTMLRQRRQGGVVRFTVERLKGNISTLDDLHHLPSIVEDLNQLSTVTKYLPEDDRPGILTLSLVRNTEFRIQIDDKVGVVALTSENIEAAHVTFPSLLGLGVQSVHLVRNESEELISKVLLEDSGIGNSLPPIWVRFIGNEMEPTVEIKLHGLCFDYRVTTIMAIMGLEEVAAREELLRDIMSSVANLTSLKPNVVVPVKLSNQGSSSSEKSVASPKIPDINLRMMDVIVGLNPRGSLAKGLLLLEEIHMLSVLSENKVHAMFEVKRVSIMVIDDHSQAPKTTNLDTPGNHVEYYASSGYVHVGTLLAAKLVLEVFSSEKESSRSIDAQVDGGLLLLESCADSTQTLQMILTGLAPPMPKSKELKYRTEVVPVDDMLASFSGNAYAMSEESPSDNEEQSIGLDEGDLVDDEVPENLEFVSSFYNPGPQVMSLTATDSVLEEDLDSIASPPIIREIRDKTLLESFEERAQIAAWNGPLDFREDHFGGRNVIGGEAHMRDTCQDAVELSKYSLVRGSPLKARIRGFHIIWNLFDGYDWQATRDSISQTVADIQSKAAQTLSLKDKRRSLDLQDIDEDVIGDFLFNSIYIGVPANRDPADLARQVNRNIDDLASETGSYATSTSSSSPSRQGHTPRQRDRRLRLKRSKHHKMTFELKGIAADFTVFPPGTGETQSSIDLRIQDLEIFDHVPTSTWKKFATYMHDAGERESGACMIHLEILNVKPVPDLSASELILKVSFWVPCSILINTFSGHYFAITTSCRPRCPRLYVSVLRIQR